MEGDPGRGDRVGIRPDQADIVGHRPPLRPNLHVPPRAVAEHGGRVADPQARVMGFMGASYRGTGGRPTMGRKGIPF